ncbi:hypothetical protein EBS02_07790 [bacterium]|nr:hypothetical protein [bacterium]
MSYDIEAIKRKIAALSGNKSATLTTENKNRPKLTYWKPQIGQHDVRILPYRDSNGQPVQEVSYYDSRLLSERRFVAPAQFGMPDPIFDMLTDLRKDRSSKSSWKLFTQLRPRERYYIPIFVRGEEAKGVQLWEFNSKMLKDLYAIFAHPDYSDEDLTHPESGYDFTVTVTPTEKTFNGFPVKDIKLQPRRKPSPLAASEGDRTKILAGIPNLEEIFKSQVKNTEQLNEVIENFLASKSSIVESMEVSESNSSSSAGDEDLEEEVKPAPKKVSSSKKKIDEAFSALDD